MGGLGDAQKTSSLNRAAGAATTPAGCRSPRRSSVDQGSVIPGYDKRQGRVPSFPAVSRPFLPHTGARGGNANSLRHQRFFPRVRLPGLAPPAMSLRQVVQADPHVLGQRQHQSRVDLFGRPAGQMGHGLAHFPGSPVREVVPPRSRTGAAAAPLPRGGPIVVPLVPARARPGDRPSDNR